MTPELISRIHSLCERGTERGAVSVGLRAWRLRCGASPDLFVKLYAANGRRAFKREVNTLELLSACDVEFWHPRLLGQGLALGNGVAFIVTDCIGTRTLGEIAQIRRYERQASLAIVGALLAHFHRSQLPKTLNPDQALTAALRSCEAHVRIATQNGEATAASFARATYRWIETNGVGLGPTVLCHGDLHPQNIMVVRDQSMLVPNALGIVDFESSHPDPAVFDVAKSIVVCGDGDKTDTAALLSGYGSYDFDPIVLLGLQAFHAVDGWVYARLIARRNVALWNSRLSSFGSLVMNARR